MSGDRWQAVLHERDHMSKLMGKPLGEKPWVVRDFRHHHPWPRYWEGHNGTKAVRFKTQKAAQRCADKLNLRPTP